MRELLVQTIVGPLIASIIAVLFARAGLAGKQKMQEFYVKRLELIEKILSLEPAMAKARPGAIDCDPLYDEIEDIIARIRLMTLSLEDQAQLHFYKQPWYKRFWKLPKPQSRGGWSASMVFYGYGLGVVYVVISLKEVIGPSADPARIGFLLFGGLFSLGIAWTARKIAIRSAESAVILERARRQLLQHTTTD